MTDKRLFIALTCTDAERAELARDQAALLARTRKARPVAAGNFHLTLAFLGMQNEEGERAVAEAIAGAAHTCKPVRLALGPLGAFHRRRGGSIVWRGVAEVPELDHLQRTLVHELAQRGIELDARPFVGHITLARNVRVNEGDDLDRLCAELTEQPTGRPAGKPSYPQAGCLTAGPRSSADSGSPATLPAMPSASTRSAASSETTSSGMASSGTASSGMAISFPKPPTLHTSVSLMWSHRPEGGVLTYTSIATFELSGEAES